MLERLQKNPSLVNILMCAGGEIPGAGPWLAARLDEKSTASQVSRARIRVLAKYPGEDEYRAVERLLGSDQEGDALRSLARMDWVRTLPHLLKAAGNPGLHTAVLHILHERKKAVGPKWFVQEWAAFAATHSGFSVSGLMQILTGTPFPYNSFKPPEVSALMNALDPDRTPPSHIL